MMTNRGERTRPIRKEICFDEDELMYIHRKMSKAQIQNFSAYIRLMAVDGQVRVIDYSVLKNVRLEINRIGVNVNQIAKQVNEQDEATQDQVFACVRQLEDLKILLENLIEQEVKREEKE